MKLNEQDILDIVKEDMEQVEVPESLSPAQIEKKLEQVKPAKKKRKIYYYGSLAAACLVLAAGIYTIGSLRVTEEQPEIIVEEKAEKSEERTEDAAAESTEVVEPEKSALKTAESYDDVYEFLKANEKQKESNGLDDVVDKLFNAFSGGAKDIAVTEDAAAESSKEMGADYSTTNVRQEGVDEADVVKTDGRYLYILRNDESQIAIVDTKGDLKEVHTISLEENQYVHEFYLLPEEKKLIAICNDFDDAVSGDVAVAEEVGMVEDIAYSKSVASRDVTKTKVLTYDVSDVRNSKKVGTVVQSGGYTSSRLSDGHLYLFSVYYVNDGFERENPELYIPESEGRLLDAKDIYLPETDRGCMYQVITSIDVNSPDEAKDSKAIFTNGGDLYVSNHNIYYYETIWDEKTEKEHTKIRKVSYDDGELNAVAKCEIDGYINDSFSIDEYEDNLRIVVTVAATNSVYVMDENLKKIGEINGLAEDERVYSARFMGDTAYFVTFRETDPLFTVDLSNPKDPKIIGKLKIPGFSDYLHFYGEDRLLGIGMDVDEETQVTGGVKLSMFDISDKSDVKEAATYVLDNVYSTDVSYDYKAALINDVKNIIGFPAWCEGGQNYYLFSYDEAEGFVCKLNEEINGNGSGLTRGVYIDDTLYVVQGNIIEAYSLKEYEKVDDLIL